MQKPIQKISIDGRDINIFSDDINNCKSAFNLMQEVWAAVSMTLQLEFTGNDNDTITVGVDGSLLINGVFDFGHINNF